MKENDNAIRAMQTLSLMISAVYLAGACAVLFGWEPAQQSVTFLVFLSMGLVMLNSARPS